MWQLTFTGNLGKDPTYGKSEDGTPYALFSVAVNKGKDTPPLWINVSLSGKPAVSFSERMPIRGCRVVVASNYPATLTLYTNKAGNVEPVLKVRADFVEVAQSDERP